MEGGVVSNVDQPAARAAWSLEQPAAGIVSASAVMLVSLLFISLFDYATFSTWVSFLLLTLIPVQIVVAVLWRAEHPAFAAKAPQPARGAWLTLLAVAAAAVIAAVLYFTVGGGVSPPLPQLVQFAIVVVVVTFWVNIAWAGWPVTAWVQKPVLAGATVLVACYLVNFLLFSTLFNYAFLADAPIYVAALDPGGAFDAWYVLVFMVTTLIPLFGLALFDLWPLTRSQALMKQPVLGLVWTLFGLAVAGLLFYVGVGMLGADVVTFLVNVPVPFIFGSIIVLNMLQGSLFASVAQPLKGLLSLLAVIVIGQALAWLYRALSPLVVGELAAGPPGYDLELWLASALLAVTFPLLALHAEFFKLWPFRR
jgi:hypothetical protein